MGLVSLKLLFVVLLVILLPIARSQVDEWHDNYGTIGKEKVTRLHFYHHETSSSKDPTVVTMAEAPTTKNSPSFFGLLGMTDNILTEGPEPTSTYLGRAQGLLAASSREEFSLVMATSFVFKGGNFSGSSLSVLGRNPFMDSVREMPVVGGTGAFRFARGFAVVKTYWVNATSHDLIEEYHMTVMHY
ncbi:Plant disease resistance response protein [Macleaya cordata]|uniref:Dirigent protein n=1 Tax=Macleaya cordata TaxID=56857 RepID=A0A200QMZ9_MACCD|nr:Plant disease resistance response protein [Macleaya cordata]